MTLLNITNLTWAPGRMKRSLAIFTHLLKSSATLDSGVYINTIRVCRKRLTNYFASPKLTEIAKYAVQGKHVTVLQPDNSLPFSYRSVASAKTSASLLSRRLRKYVGKPYILWINTIGPLDARWRRRLPAMRITVFDSSDDLTSLEPADPDGARRRLRRILQIADSVLCVNQNVYDLIEHPKKRVFRNCTTFETMQRRQPDFEMAPWYRSFPGNTYIGFIGSITEERIDKSLVDFLFRRLADCTFLFVGYIDSSSLLQYLTSYPNVRVLDPVRNEDLGEVIRGFDVAIVPHNDNALTRGNDLLKVLDYLACGVPVVSTPVSDVQLTVRPSELHTVQRISLPGSKIC